MSDSTVDIKITTSADTQPIKALEKELKGAEQAVKDIPAAAKKAEASLDNFSTEVIANLQAVKQKTQETQDALKQAGEQGGAGMVDNLSGKLAGVDWEDMLGRGAAVAAAAASGYAIGQMLGDAINRISEDGLSWDSILGTQSAEEQAGLAAVALRDSFAQIQEDYTALVQALEAGPKEDATKWLSDLDEGARRAAESLKTLHGIESAKNKAAAADAQATHADKLNEIEGSNASPADKKMQKAAADVERDTALFVLREKERQAKVEQAAMEAAQARKRITETQNIEVDQERRARAAIEVDMAEEKSRAESKTARAPITEEDPQKRVLLETRQKQQEDDAAKQVRAREAQKKGFDPDDLGSAEKEKSKLDISRKAVEKARAESRSAALKRDGTAATAGIESASDKDTMLRGSKRTLDSALRAAEVENQRAKKRQDDERAKAASSEGPHGKTGGGTNELPKVADAAKGAADANDKGNRAVVQFATATTAEMQRLRKSNEDLEKRIVALNNQMKNARTK